MGVALQTEAEIWCPRCRETVGKIVRKQLNDEVWGFEKRPKNLPPRCTRCEGVLQRRMLS